MKRLLLLPLAFLASCSNENTLYEENKALSPELEWKQEDVRTFSFTNTDTESVVNETVLFRYANGYQFDKMIVEVIKEAEKYERGYYTGIFGIFDGENIDSGVMIRFMENTPDGKVYKSGGGITSRSNMEEEYHELVDKIYIPVINSNK